MLHQAATIVIVVAGWAWVEARADEQLPDVVVRDERPQSAASADDIRARDFELRPHATLQDILNNVPGLIVRQHQGGGKASQYLIRGFNADHGTDFAVFVDGLPVNLPTHAHGQGYADANFIIPETISRLELRKGPYFPELGDFATAGGLNLVTKDRFDENFALAEGGSFARQRYVVGFSPELGDKLQAMVAGQAYFSDGPFLNPEHFARYNGYSKITYRPTDVLTLSVATGVYAADWDASGQIPLREVSAGRLERFGAIDPTEGGRTDRQNLDGHVTWRPTARDQVAVQLYASRYKLKLWSNFTFFQNDPVHGDQIEQNDHRSIFGTNASWTRTWEAFAIPTATTFGLQGRRDDIDVAVHHTQRRRRLSTQSSVRALQQSYGLYWGQQVFLTDWLRFEGGLRGDGFFFDVDDRGAGQSLTKIHGRSDDSIVSPKANLIVGPFANTEVYLNFGEGYHSNDARVVAQAEDAGNPQNSPLVKAVGYELGTRTRQWNDRLDLAAALWLMDLESELVFCGDCGTTEGLSSFRPSLQGSRRWGVDFEARLRVLDWLTADYDLMYADPRFDDGSAIPIAPTLAMNGGLSAEFANGFSAAVRTRFLDDRPATEDRRLPARGYLVFDAFAKYRWRNVEVGLDLLNFTDFDWMEAVFADTSCTKREAKAGRCPTTPDIHFTPGDPFGVRARLIVYF